MNFYAQWAADSYTIQFTLNGGDSEIPVAQVLRVGEYVTEPAVRKRAGYLFQGWQGSVDGEEIMWDFNQDTVSDQDMTLTAVWKQANSIPVDPVNPVTPVTPSIPVTPALPNHQHTVENKGYQTVQKNK
ncbi:InlB B-repeat-containing protein [Listeria cornellensis]|uniref:Internalin like protein (LPXTG) n=1 Tax=Listeria cornellensis FSL F6-0969 TaxID=1265820 RepID=W7CA49_9LIST|nr:InlB B-repeat-containing protein [Listeria cornellensis]EUJ29558.1 internalin like protein (LPXTG) [Listeria cornellensis FSL F6-0969]